jgi:hypothetical protein
LICERRLLTVGKTIIISAQQLILAGKNYKQHTNDGTFNELLNTANDNLTEAVKVLNTTAASMASRGSQVCLLQHSHFVS